MKTSRFFVRTSLLLALFASGLLLCQNVAAAVSFTVTPSVVSNTYSGFINLQIGGLTNGEPVKVAKYCDFNGNGAVNPEDFRVQAFSLTNGQVSVIGGVTNINVPGDWDSSATSILVPMSLVSAGFEQQMVGHYIFRLVSPFNNFTPVTVPFTVTNSAFAQSLSGTVLTGTSTPVPNAGVLLFGGAMGDSYPQGGVLADSSGNYTINVVPGTYSVVAFKSNYVADLSVAPVVTLSAGMTVSTNLHLLAATATISGNANLPAIMVGAMTANNLMAIGFSDTNGSFTLPVTASQWGVFIDSAQPALYGLLGRQDNPSADTTTTNVTGLAFTYARGTALFYGSVKDGQNRPLAGVRLNGLQNYDSPYQAEAVSDPNGNYALAVTADTWHVEIENKNTPFAGYVFSQRSADVTFTNGQVVRQDFLALLATNHISGYLRDGSNNPISGVSVSAQANINGADYQANTDTDGAGHYVINVGNGTWNVSVSCGTGNHSLSSDYLCPGSQPVTINNNNGTADFTALLPSGQISGYVQDSSNNNPIPNVRVYAYGNSYSFSAITDSSGYFSLGVVNGDWNVGVSCSGGSQTLNALGYLCVGEQFVTVSNSAGIVNFVAEPAGVLLTGATRLANGQFQFSFPTSSGVNYTIQTSSTLSDWTSVLSFSGSGGPMTITDPGAPANASRFYRIKVGP
jgi:hypothetical protein